MGTPDQKVRVTVKSGHSAVWGLGGGIIASLCCLGPLVAVALGLGGASFLLGLSAYRPYFLAASAVFVGTGVFLTLRRSRRCCTVEQHRRNQWRYPTLAVFTFAIAFMVFQYLLPGALYRWQEVRVPTPGGTASAQSASPSAPGTVVPARLAVARLQIDGMT